MLEKNGVWQSYLCHMIPFSPPLIGQRWTSDSLTPSFMHPVVCSGCQTHQSRLWTPLPSSAFSECWQLIITHGGIYTMESDKCYKSGPFLRSQLVNIYQHAIGWSFISSPTLLSSPWIRNKLVRRWCASELNCSKKGEARKETDRLCSDNEMGEGIAKQRDKT
jgi:hypothetical protein